MVANVSSLEKFSASLGQALWLTCLPVRLGWLASQQHWPQSLSLLSSGISPHAAAPCIYFTQSLGIKLWSSCLQDKLRPPSSVDIFCHKSYWEKCVSLVKIYYNSVYQGCLLQIFFAPIIEKFWIHIFMVHRQNQDQMQYFIWRVNFGKKLTDEKIPGLLICQGIAVMSVSCRERMS